MAQILVVDDEPNICLLFHDELTEMGYDVDLASDGVQALEALDKVDYDLVILDLRMPEMNGLEFLQHARQSRPNLPVIVCTALRGMESDFELWAAHVTVILNKPVDLDLLKEHVVSVLGEN